MPHRLTYCPINHEEVDELFTLLDITIVHAADMHLPTNSVVSQDVAESCDESGLPW